MHPGVPTEGAPTVCQRPRAEGTAEASHAALATSYRSCVLTTGQRRSVVSPACEWSAQVCCRAGWCSRGDQTTVKRQRRSSRLTIIDHERSRRLTPRTRLWRRATGVVFSRALITVAARRAAQVSGDALPVLCPRDRSEAI